MGLKDALMRGIGGFFFERPGRKRSFEELAQELETTGRQIHERLAGVSPRPEDHTRLRHIIGIERWSQRRLRVFLGEPFEMDGHHPYKPAETLDWPALLDAFKETRAQTLVMIDALSKPNPDGVDAVLHNEFGAFSAKGWLKYIEGHATSEAKAIN